MFSLYVLGTLERATKWVSDFYDELYEEVKDRVKRGELAAGDTFDISYELFRFLCPGFSLPEPVGYSLSQWPAPFYDTLLLPGSRSKPLRVH